MKYTNDASLSFWATGAPQWSRTGKNWENAPKDIKYSNANNTFPTESTALMTSN